MSEDENLRLRVEELEERVTELENRLDGGGDVQTADGISEFVQSVNPSNHQERALAIGYYYETYRDYENFTNSDIEEGYRECRIPRPGNIRDVMNKLNKQEGWTMEDGKDGRATQWIVSRDGQEWIEEARNNE